MNTLRDLWAYPDGGMTRAFLVAWGGTVGAEVYLLMRLLA